MRADLSALATEDVADAVAYYRTEADPTIAAELVDALEASIKHLCRHPLTGSLRFAYELEIPDLRSWPIQRFPYVIFYVADDNRLNVWRILHARRDIPVHLASETPG